MSKVTATLKHATPPAPTTRLREVTVNYPTHGYKGAYRVNNGVIELKSGTIWHRSGSFFLQDGQFRATLTDATPESLAAIFDLVKNPTETVPAPAAEPTVVLEMPKAHAARLRQLTGAQCDSATGDVYRALREVVGS